ncbi:BMP family ABC transporter substrate-binding protein [Acuticoccus sediminis]|uniref:BMP family ABC transporter substrate-binding protein n=1 Tax=Acuticoccus sediminis TaxID=2184697 RepID=A0A8B2NHD8_9HYPH|nr:BMP family protein [Acuticoccus sediminis]RAH96742.1 BMP family ABC transporter substrate-binding protein [Acuticoccus sediminis]
MSRTLRFRAALAAFAIAASLTAAQADEPVRVGGLFAGRIDDGGFMQAGYTGLAKAGDALGVTIDYTDGIKPEPDLLAEALRALAADHTLVIAHGGQNSAAAKTVAAEFPDVTFVVTQGGVTGDNLSSYEVLQEQSAFLAGVLAARVTKTGTVGHMSGIKVKPGLKGRAAYIAGVAYADPDVTVLTNFSGDQDDNALSAKIANAMADAGADVVFTMLNAGRTGAIDAMRERGVRQIGNVVDWTAIDPVFVGSAMADSGMALFDAVSDYVSGAFEPGVVRRIGLDTPEAVSLAVADDVPQAVRDELAAVAAKIVAGEIEVPTEWEGEEFTVAD